MVKITYTFLKFELFVTHQFLNFEDPSIFEHLPAVSKVRALVRPAPLASVRDLVDLDPGLLP